MDAVSPDPACTALQDPWAEMLHASGLALQVCDPSGTLVQLSESWCQLTGLELQATLGKRFVDLVTPDYQALAEAALMGDFADAVSLYLTGPEAEPVPVRIQRLHHDADYTVALLIDDSPMDQLRDALDESHAAMVQARQAKARFLAGMSHDIRTPLNAIMGFSQLLADSEFPEKAQRRVQAILSASQNLSELIDDLLDLSQTETGPLPQTPVPFDPKRLANQLIQQWREPATRAGLRLSVETSDANLASSVNADLNRITRVLNGFLAHAIEQTHEGEVVLEVGTGRAAGGLEHLRLQVRDTRGSFDLEQLRKSLRGLWTIDETSAEALDQGSIETQARWDIGMAICGQIAKGLGGDAGAEQSSAPEGAIVWMDIPLTAERPGAASSSEETAKQNGQSPITRPLHILLVEDDRHNQDVMQAMLNEMGHSVVAVSNGYEALETLPNVGFDLVVMDIMMPGLDGVTTTERIRAMGGSASTVPIICCTGRVTAQNQIAYRKSGMNGLLPKPVDQGALARQITEVIGD